MYGGDQTWTDMLIANDLAGENGCRCRQNLGNTLALWTLSLRRARH